MLTFKPKAVQSLAIFCLCWTSIICIASLASSKPVFAQSTFTTPVFIDAVTGLLLNDCGPQNEDVYDGNVLIETQSDLNALSRVAIIIGELRIESDDNLDFSPLNGLVEVTAGIRIEGNTSLSRISGFNCLKKTGSILIYRNPAVTEISGFNELETMDGWLEITNTDTTTSAQLTHLSGFSSLQHVKGAIIFYRLPNLLSLPLFPSLHTVDRYIDINRLSGLTDIEGFNALNTLNTTDSTNGLQIRRNLNMTRITGFANLNRSAINGSVEVYSNTNLDCANPAPSFLPTTRSDGNSVDCPVSP